MDEHQSRKRREDKGKSLGGMSVEKRALVEERRGEVGNAGMTAILCVEEEGRVCR